MPIFLKMFAKYRVRTTNLVKKINELQLENQRNVDERDKAKIEMNRVIKANESKVEILAVSVKSWSDTVRSSSPGQPNET